jgi:hypothetical protein
MTAGHASPQTLSERQPEAGELVQVRSRRWLVEEVIPSDAPGQSSLVRLACADDDAQGQALDVFWDSRDTRRVFEELLGTAERSIWASTYAFFDGPRVFEVLRACNKTLTGTDRSSRPTRIVQFERVFRITKHC